MQRIRAGESFDFSNIRSALGFVFLERLSLEFNRLINSFIDDSSKNYPYIAKVIKFIYMAFIVLLGLATFAVFSLAFIGVFYESNFFGSLIALYAGLALSSTLTGLTK